MLLDPPIQPVMLEKEFKYYKDHQTELVKAYKNKFIVIKGQKVVGAYDSHNEAYNDSVGKFKLGTFLIQHCLPGKDSYTQTFHSQVIIHGTTPKSVHNKI